MSNPSPSAQPDVPFKQPAILATIFTLIVGGVFLGALYSNAGHGHGGGAHTPNGHGSAAPSGSSAAPVAPASH